VLRLLTTPVCISVNLLAIEVSWLKSTESATDSCALRAIDSFRQESLDDIVETSDVFFSLQGSSSLASAFVSFNEAFAKLPFIRHRFANMDPFLQGLSGNLIGFHSDKSIDGHNMTTTNSWVESFCNGVLPASLSPTMLVVRLDTAYSVVSQEMRCQQSWASFTQLLLPVMLRWWRDSRRLEMIRISQGSFLPALTAAILRSFRSNIDLVERARAKVDRDDFLARDCHAMASAVSEVLLAILSLEDWSPTSQQCLESLGFLAEIAGKSLSVAPFRAIWRVLASSAILETMVSKGNERRMKCIMMHLATTACDVLTALEKATVEPADSLGCFGSCVALLSGAVDTVTTPSNNPMGIDMQLSEHLCQVCDQRDVVRSLMAQAALLGEVTIVTTLGLFTKMAATGAPALLSLLVNNRSVLFLSNPMAPHFQFDVGSVSTWHNEESSMARWNLLGACLRSSRDLFDAGDSFAEHLFSIAANFIIDNENMILVSFAQCSGVEFGPNASREHFFTVRKLRHTKLFLAIVSELCRSAPEAFKNRCQHIFSALSSQAASFVMRLGAFLAASATSRDIFLVLLRVDEMDATIVDQDPPYSSLGPLSRLLAEGVQNAKHEAIRYASHFVLSCCRATTQTENQACQVFSDHWKDESQEEVQSGTLAYLERTRRSTVTSKFAFEMEVEAAESVYFALQMLWATHPASASFVLFTENELARVDVMHFVRPGTVIAFRDHPKNRKPRLAIMGITGSPGLCSDARVLIGTVSVCNTVDRQWRVLVSDGSNAEECIVDASQLAGIEDVERRTAMLAYAAAPDTAADLENMRGPISVGHLILVLRWCSQFYTEERDKLLERDTNPFVVRLAELTCSLLGMELSVREQCGIQEQHMDMTRKVLARQILELLGESADFAMSSHGLSDTTRDGRLKRVLSPKAWQGTRSQLKCYISLAVTEHSPPNHVAQRRTAGISFPRGDVRSPSRRLQI
jgi:hypothetical protein